MNDRQAQLEQEPLTNFRRDLVADDEWRLRVEAVVDELVHESRLAIAWAVRRICRSDVDQTYVSRPVFRGFDVILQASEILR